MGRNSVQTNRNSDEESLYRKNHFNIAEEPEMNLESGPSVCNSPKMTHNMAPHFKNKTLESTITLDKEV